MKAGTGISRWNATSLVPRYRSKTSQVHVLAQKSDRVEVRWSLRLVRGPQICTLGIYFLCWQTEASKTARFLKPIFYVPNHGDLFCHLINQISCLILAVKDSLRSLRIP